MATQAIMVLGCQQRPPEKSFLTGGGYAVASHAWGERVEPVCQKRHETM